MDILVATSHDFALLRDGRPLASGAWDDVRRASAGACAGRPAGTMCLALELPSGTFVAGDDAPGWDDLLDAAESALPGLPRRHLWWADAQAARPDHPVVLFERRGRAG